MYLLWCGNQKVHRDYPIPGGSSLPDPRCALREPLKYYLFFTQNRDESSITPSFPDVLSEVFADLECNKKARKCGLS